MLDREIYISIPGHPAPKGSMKCIGGRGGKGHVLIEDNARTKDWRAVVAVWCRKKWPRDAYAAPGQPVGVEVTFTLPRPAGHYGTGRNAALVKGSAPTHPVGHNTGDLDKLTRLICDALQDAAVIPDDAAVIELVARKSYVDGDPHVPDRLGYPGVVIRVYPWEES